MRKITQEAKFAYENNLDYKKANTEVKTYTENRYGFPEVFKVQVLLHGNEILHKIDSFDNWIEEATLAGWGSATTRERLNGILGDRASFTQKKGEQWFNDEQITDLEQWYFIVNRMED